MARLPQPDCGQAAVAQTGRAGVRRSRWRGVFKWSGTIICGLILLTAIACLKWKFIFINDGYEHWLINFVGGKLVLLRPIPSEWSWGFNGMTFDVVPFERRGEAFEMWTRGPLWFPVLEIGGDLIMPLWIPFVLIGVPTALLWRADRRRIRSDCCRKCGYDLTGNVSGRCPECGTASGA